MQSTNLLRIRIVQKLHNFHFDLKNKIFETAKKLYAAFKILDKDKSITAGVITSTSKNFCSGYDLKSGFDKLTF